MKTIEERLEAIEANVSIIVSTVQDIAQALGIRNRVRSNLVKLRERITEPPPPGEEEKEHG